MEKSDRDISAWDARLKQQLERSFHNYHKRRIDLSVARDNKQFDWTGEILIVEKASSSNAIATVRLMFDDADPLTLEKNVEIRSIFNRLFVTNNALVGEWLDVIAGINFEYKKKIAELELVYVNRGDPDADEFTVGSFTQNNNWNTLDLSSIIVDGPRAVHITLLGKNTTTADREIIFRTKGNVNQTNAAVFRITVADVYHSADVWVYTNAAGEIEYKATVGSFNELYFRVRGWLPYRLLGF